MTDRLIPTVILGQDDWLIFGRTADGTLVYTVIETDWHWLDAPHGGLGECDCPDDMAACRIDSSWMHLYVSEHRDGYYWQKCNPDIDGTALDWPESEDAAFVARSRQTYLCD
jgi:hypothetical protein